MGTSPHRFATQSDRRAVGLWFVGPRSIELRSEPLPEPGPDQVMVRAVVSAISHGTEMLVYRGLTPPGLELDLPTLQGILPFPVKYGYASVGRVEETGAAVTHLRAGDPVFVHHPHQTRYVVPASLVVRLPEGLEQERALFLANLETAVNVLLDSALRLGERVVVFGQGVVGLLLTQLFRRAGAGMVIGVEPTPLRQELARRLGADEVLQPEDGLPLRVRELTGGIGADLVVEASGDPFALDLALRSVAFQGTVLVCSWYGTRPVTLNLGDAFHRKRLRLVSSQVSTIDPALQPRWDRQRRLALAVSLLHELQLEALITHRVPFGQAPEAYILVDQRPEECIQVVLTYEDKGV